MIAAGMVLRVGDLPGGLKLKEGIPNDPDHLLLKGGSCIFGPDGSTLLEPQYDLDDTIILKSLILK